MQVRVLRGPAAALSAWLQGTLRSASLRMAARASADSVLATFGVAQSVLECVVLDAGVTGWPRHVIELQGRSGERCA